MQLREHFYLKLEADGNLFPLLAYKDLSCAWISWTSISSGFFSYFSVIHSNSIIGTMSTYPAGGINNKHHVYNSFGLLNR